MSANEMPERHTDTERNKIINRASSDLEQIINGHDPEIHHLGNRVWDRLDKMALEIENRADLCVSGQQVRALELRLRDWQGRAEMAGRALEAVLSGKPVRNADEIVSFCKTAALTPAPQPEVAPMDNTALVDVAASLAAAISLLERGGKSAKKAAASDKMFDQMLADYRASLERARTALASREAPQAATQPAQEAVPVAWMKNIDGAKGLSFQSYDGWTPLYAHPPQPSETVAEALKLAAARLQRLALEIPSTTSLRAEAFEWADEALRALKGGSDV